jgi:twitching motility protein PilT
MALRVIETRVPTPEELGLPSVVKDFTRFERGLVILTGATGSGKSTTIASLINEINFNYAKNIITIEDPIEYLFADQRSIISQREIGADARTFPSAMISALREDPDVILLGEMRDSPSIDTALTAAETGHLVLTTLHSPAAADTVPRIISSFAPDAQGTIRAKLAQNLRAVVAQRLLPRADGGGRTVACEVMTAGPRVRELILDPLRVKEISDLVKGGAIVEGMLSFDQHLFELCRRGDITDETALQHATSPTDLKLKLDGF